jgi:hypothetical protein
MDSRRDGRSVERVTHDGARDGATQLLAELLDALRLPATARARVRFIGADRLASCFPVSELAAASIGAAAAAVAELSSADGVERTVEVDLRLASLWFGWSIRPIGWSMPSAWDELAGDYRCDSGWIKLHTNAPHHRAAALSVLGCEPTREAVARAVGGRDGDELEAAVVAAGGCAARLRTIDEWSRHPQGQAVATEPLVIWDRGTTTRRRGWAAAPDRPLDGLRVLDLTRIIAGPVATRFLAAFGADVLRVDPLEWDEPVLAPEVLLGKRCTRLDLRDPSHRVSFERLLAEADVIVHGYRADALDRLGYGPDERQEIRPGLVDVSLDAYGHCGPWAYRRGFDSLVQFSTGIAAEGMTWRAAERPVSLPVQALDHATGYLLAAAVLGAVGSAASRGRTQRARVSLARTAKLLVEHRREPVDTPIRPPTEIDLAAGIESTAWGPARRLRPPVQITGAPMRWTRPPARLGSSPPTWTP